MAELQCNTTAAATRISLPTDDAMPHVCGAVTQISPAGVVIVVTRGCGGDHRRGLWQSGDAMWPARLHEKDDGVRWRWWVSGARLLRAGSSERREEIGERARGIEEMGIGVRASGGARE